MASAEESKGANVIEAGRFSPYFAVFKPFVEKHFGIEYSPESDYRGHKADVFGDAKNLPLGIESVDTILCTEVLEHLPNPEKAISEFARILRPNGTIITAAPFFYPIHDQWDFFRYSPDGLASIMKQNAFGNCYYASFTY